jgi:hypothetical protein
LRAREVPGAVFDVGSAGRRLELIFEPPRSRAPAHSAPGPVGVETRGVGQPPNTETPQRSEGGHRRYSRYQLGPTHHFEAGAEDSLEDARDGYGRKPWGDLRYLAAHYVVWRHAASDDALQIFDESDLHSAFESLLSCS